MHSNFDSLLDYLYQLQRLGIKTGLSHTEQLLKKCGNPQQSLQIVHIAGTNGKGSTSAMIESILRTSGYKTGLYTSPHLNRFNERIRINGKPIEDVEIIRFVRKYKKDIDLIQSTFFETTTAMAFWYFQKENVDYSVVETGLGGRLDSTNVIQPLASVITTISIDHKEILGDSIEKIAYEKAGIIKEGVPVFSYKQPEEVGKIFQKKADEKRTTIQFIQTPQIASITDRGTTFILQNEQYSTALIGDYQASNAALAIGVVKEIFPKISKEAIQKGLQTVHWPGRFQIVKKNPTIIYDVAHNVEGIQNVLKNIVRLYNQTPIGIMGVKGDKEIESIAGIIKNQFHELWVMDDENGLLMNRYELEKQLMSFGVPAKPVEDLKTVLGLLNKNHPILIFGSHYIGSTVLKSVNFPFDKGYI